MAAYCACMSRSFSAPVTPSDTESDIEGRGFSKVVVGRVPLFVVAVMDGMTFDRIDSIFEDRDATSAEVGNTLSVSLFDIWVDVGRLEVTAGKLFVEPEERNIASASGLDIIAIQDITYLLPAIDLVQET